MTPPCPTTVSRSAGLLAWTAALLLASPLAGAAHVAPNEIRFVLPPDAIPAITDPKFDDGAWLRPLDDVIGLEQNGEARAYPLRILVWHEIADDVVGGTAVAVTYCPLCGTGIVFDRSVGDQVLTFKVSGKLYKSDLVMFDVETGSLWTQVLGQAIDGSLHGTRLDMVPSALMKWKNWERLHPRTQVLSRETGHDRDYNVDPYAGYQSSRRIGIGSEQRADVYTIHPKEFVLGWEEGSQAIAFRYSRLAETRYAQVEFGQRALLATFDEGAAHLYEAAGHNFTGDPNGNLADERAVRWDPAAGTSERGERLARLPAVPAFWFAWYDFHSSTKVWGALGVRALQPGPDQLVSDPRTPIRLEFTEPINASHRDRILEFVSVDRAVGLEAEWTSKLHVTLRPLQDWPRGRVTVVLSDELVDENGTLLGSRHAATFRVGPAQAPGPNLLGSLLAAALAWLVVLPPQKLRGPTRSHRPIPIVESPHSPAPPPSRTVQARL